MDKDELKKHDGSDGGPAYVAYDGKIYDVSKSVHWCDGHHMGRHRAGEDLTDFLPLAPHGTEVFERVTVAGTVDEDEGAGLVGIKPVLRNLYRKFHPHPVLIHFPVGLFLFGALMQFLFLLTGDGSFERAALYAILCATLAVPPAAAAGFLSWWLNYDMTLTSIFRNKIFFTSVLLVSAVVIVAVRFTNPGVSTLEGPLSYIYNALVFMNVPVTLFIAYNGGKITWPS